VLPIPNALLGSSSRAFFVAALSAPKERANGGVDVGASLVFALLQLRPQNKRGTNRTGTMHAEPFEGEHPSAVYEIPSKKYLFLPPKYPFPSLKYLFPSAKYLFLREKYINHLKKYLLPSMIYVFFCLPQWGRFSRKATEAKNNSTH